MSKLKTELKHWDKHLSNLYNKRNFCLDIGSYTGKSTCWMLNNLCSNPYSKVYSIDRWKACDDCSEYKEYTDKIEKEFDKNVEKTGRQNQNVKMNLNSNKAIIKLKSTGIIIFDFIFIDASHEPNDILSNAILSWEILNENGILIFDDYEWDNNKNEKFKPKYAIDTFVHLYNLQLEVLHVGYHYIVKKINQKYTHKEKAEYYDLFDEINNFRIEILEDVVFDDVIEEELEFELKITKDDTDKYRIPDINEDGISNSDILPKIFEINNNNRNMYILYSRIINKYSKLNDIKLLIDFNMKDYLLNRLFMINIINHYIKNNKYNILLNYNIDSNKKINSIIKHYDIIKNNKVSINNLLINNIDVYNKLITNKNKYNLIFFGYSNIPILYSYNNTYLLYNICIALNTQNINGDLIIITSVKFDNNLINECIYLLKKFYIKVIIRNLNTLSVGTTFLIIANNFIGIDEKSSMKINLLIKNIYNKINNNNNITIIKNNNNFIKDKMNKFIVMKKNNIMKTINLYNNIYKFIKINDNLLNKNIRLLLFKLLLNDILISK